MQVYFINLDRCPERNAFMWRQCEALGLETTRIPAVDGHAIILPDRRVDTQAFSRRHHAALRPGEIGCYLSHVSALRTFLCSGAAHGLILEDDARLATNLWSVLVDLMRIDDQWDLVKLYATHPGGILDRADLRGGHRLVSLAFRHGASAAYVVNRRAAMKLLAGLLPMTVPYDHEFDRAWKYGIKLRAVMPFPVGRQHFNSTIGAKPAHKPWYAQGGMLAFRGWNDIARVVYELSGDRRIPFA
jgi:glycosyl transferase family 25